MQGEHCNHFHNAQRHPVDLLPKSLFQKVKWACWLSLCKDAPALRKIGEKDSLFPGERGVYTQASPGSWELKSRLFLGRFIDFF